MQAWVELAETVIFLGDELDGHRSKSVPEEPDQPAETPAEVVDDEAASSSLPWRQPDPDDIPPERRGPS